MASENKKSLNPMLIVGLAIVALGAGVFGYLEYGPKPKVQEVALTPEGKAYVRNLRLSDVGIQAADSYMGGRIVEVVGNIGNAGERALASVEIYCIFYDPIGQLVLRKRVPIVAAKTGGLKPGDTKPFRLPFDEIPESWNQAMPNLVIASVQFQ